MAEANDVNELFRTLKNANGSGDAPSTSAEGDAKAGKVAMPVLAFVDNSDELVYPKLNPEGALPVSLDAGTTIRASGSADGDKTQFVDVATAVLTASKQYTKLSAIGSCNHNTLWEIVQIDDVGVTDVENILGEFNTGPGQFSFRFKLDPDKYTAGSTDIQNLILRGKNLSTESKLKGAISTNELA